jgi:RHS repeat-associated protein
MLIEVSASRIARGVMLFATLNFVVTPVLAEGLREDRRGADQFSFDGLAHSDDSRVLAVRLSLTEPEASFEGLKVRLPSVQDRWALRSDVSVLLQCDRFREQGSEHRIRNLTDGCASFSVYTTDPVTVEIPYRSSAINDEVEEAAISVFRGARVDVAMADIVRPLDSYVDRENKRTVATLHDQSGKYIAGILKSIEGPDRAAPSFKSQALASLRQSNPLTGVPLVAKPQSNNTGDARVSFPLELPGVRGDFAPSVGITYASKSGYGLLGESWQLSIPEITVETRWGVPVYDPELETETYLFNGDQLVPEAGEAFVGDPSDALHLVPIPHRTTNLRPRKSGEARFVVRRDESLWRLIRHGSTPADYWWEAWQEKPGSAAPKVSYFGNAPGRIPGAIENGYWNNGFVMRIGSIGGNPNVRAISKWVLAREVDAHRNVIDYDWSVDCQPAIAGDSECIGASTASASSRQLIPQRILYTSNLATEETVLRCRENRAATGCDREWASYEMLFTWLEPDAAYRRSDLRSGGLTVVSRLLNWIDVRGRRLDTARLGDTPLQWSCSKPFLRYSFAYRGEFDADVTPRGTGRAFLKSIKKQVGGRENVFRARDGVGASSCAPPAAGTGDGDWEANYTNRFEYDLDSVRTWGEPGTSKVDLERAETFPLVDTVKDALGGEQKYGPVAPSMLGTTATTDASVSFYGGLNLFNWGKNNSFGVKGHSTNRTGYVESTSLIDVDGDGISDVVVRVGDGDYKVHRGRLDASGRLTFADGVSMSVPAGFVGFNREPFQSTSGIAFEAHLFYTYLASMSSSTSAMQDTYVADVNGDGRPDVVSNGKVLFNTSSTGQFSFGLTQDGGFIDPRSRAGVPGPMMPALLNAASSGVPQRWPSEYSPRIDPVRVWRAPFSGDVFIRGKIVYAPPAVPSDLRGTQDGEKDETVKNVRLADHRDGLLFTVEVNQGRGWDRGAPVKRCFAAKFEGGAPPLAKTIELTTQAPGAAAAVPVVACYAGTRPGWPAMPALPPELSADKGLLVSVGAGDVIYFRTHSIDNAQDDIIRFAPAIDYVRLADEFQSGGADPRREIAYGATATSPRPDISSVLSSMNLTTSTCAQLDVIDANGVSSKIDETSLGLCDRWGRSVVRYRLLDEQDRFANGAGLLTAPFTGRARFEGRLVKPETLLSGEVAIRILTKPPVPDHQGKVTEPNPDCGPETYEVANTVYKPILRFGQAAGSYQATDSSDATIFVERGQRICAFLRFFDRSEPTTWPQDMSGFSWQGGGLSMLFDRKLLTVQLDNPQRNPDDLLPEVDRAATQAPLSECPAASNAPIQVKFPAPRDNPDDPSSWTGVTTLPVHLRCIETADRHWVAPRLFGGTYGYFFAGSGPASQALRLSRRLTPIKLPPSELTCSTNNQLREYRLKLDPAYLNEPGSPLPLDDDTRRPGAYGGPEPRYPLATSRFAIAVLRDGHRQAVPILPFVVRPNADPNNPLVLTDRLLVDAFTAGGPNNKLNDLAGASVFGRQVLRHLPRTPGPNPDPADARTLVYAEFKTGAPNGPADDGVRVYPIDRVGYSFCAPDEAEIEIASVLDNLSGNPLDERNVGDRVMRSGDCGPAPAPVCPIVGSSIRVARTLLLQPAEGYSHDIPIFAQRRSAIDAESYRGWTSLSITTEYLESSALDDGATPEDPAQPLSTAKAADAATPEVLPTVRDYKRLLDRLATRKGPLANSPSDGGAALHDGACGTTPAKECVRDKFLSQIRVQPVTGTYRAQTIQQPTDWIYCIDNPRSRPKLQTEKQPNAAALAQPVAAALRSRIGVEIEAPHYCQIGPDVGVWISEDYMSTSRLGAKDLINPVYEAVAAAAAAPVAPAGDVPADRLVQFLPRLSTTETNGWAASAWAGVSRSTNNTTSSADVFDLNGDGFPDQIVGNQAYVTDPTGRLRCLTDEVWKTRFPCNLGNPANVGQGFVRNSQGDSTALSIPFSSPKTFFMAAYNAAGRANASLSGSQPSQAQASRDPAMSAPSIAAEFAKGKTERDSDLFDINGDGLPDLVGGGQAFLGAGHMFTANAVPWSGSIMEDRSSSVGLSASLGYGDDIQEYGGGISASSNSSRQTQAMADVNGDGLVDRIRVDGGTILASLNTGFGFTAERRIGQLGKPLNALGQGESDSLGANAYFTFCIPIYLVFWTIYVVINPGASLGATLNRQVIAMRDADADGLADLLVTGGIRVGSDLNMNFDNQSASMYRSPFGTHGLLTGVYLATNPEASKPSPDPSRANYRLGYARSTPSVNDPQSRWVLSEIVVRDGVDFDDAFGVHERRTCHAYESGYFDRFERRFLGFARVTTVEGCTSTPPQRLQVQLDPVSQASLPAGSNNVRDSDRLTGVRKIERVFANRSIYESGTLLSETTKDMLSPTLVAGAVSPTRTIENTYVLLDVGRSSENRQECFALGVSAAPSDGRPPMRAMLKLVPAPGGENGRIEFPARSRDGAALGPCPEVPAFDRDPRRLTPVLVQSVQSSTEGGNQTLTTTVQFAIDYRARVTRMCDLGALADRSDDLCANITYDDAIQLSFIHGATGGGTLAFDRRDRADEISVLAGDDVKNVLRRRTGAYDPATGDLIAQCAFEDTKAADPCNALKRMPLTASALQGARSQRVAVRHYRYDPFGNIDRYLSPVAADGYFALRKFTFDPFLTLVETGETTDYCLLGGMSAPGKPEPCLPGSASDRGTFVASYDDIDWRHAVATTQVDVNANVMRSVLDGNRRPIAAFASWAGDWADNPDCTRGECASPSVKFKAGARLGKLADYTYRVGADLAVSTAVARVTRYADASLYKATENPAVATGKFAFESDQHYDELGRLVRTVIPADICKPGAETPAGAKCDPDEKATHTASGIVTLDIADREVDTYLPLPVKTLPPLASALVGPLPGEDLNAAPRTRTLTDGFDRPLHVRLIDGNSYAFRYGLTAVAPQVLRHRAVVRDSRCVPTAIDRDERGLVRAVHEFANTGPGNDFDAHAIGSSFDAAPNAQIIAAGWVSGISDADPRQQVVACAEGDATAAVALPPPAPVVTASLHDPLADAGNRRRRNSTVYEYDPLNQLTGVRLPPAEAVRANEPITAGAKAIRVSYDALGRRVLTDDPDRGIESLSYDLLSNLVCHRSGPPAGSPAELGQVATLLRGERARPAGGTETRLAGEDICFEPQAAARDRVSRVVRHDYLFDRLSRVQYRYPVPQDGNRKSVAIGYGRADDTADNRANRQTKLVDVTGTLSTQQYHPLGMPQLLERSVMGVARKPGVNPVEVGKLATREVFDAWGLMSLSTLEGRFRGMRADGGNDPNDARSVSVSESVAYRYAANEQINEIRLGAPCTFGAAPVAGCADLPPPIGLITDAAFDERGNMLRQAFGNGVVARNKFDLRSNRLLESSTRMGVPCREFGPGDDCSTSSPPILFQNLAYRYDAGGNILRYDNLPAYADPCGANPCPQISHDHKRIQGLLVSHSENAFALDERGRLRSAEKLLSLFGRDDVYWSMDDKEIARARTADIKMSEAFAFSDSHLLTGIRRTVSRRFADEGFGNPETTVIRHSYTPDRPTGPVATSVKKPGPDEDQIYRKDDFGRVDLVRCAGAGCLAKKVPNEGTYDAQRYTWDPDDTLALVQRRVEPTEQQGSDQDKLRSRYYAEVEQVYDYSGNRAIKRWNKVIDRPNGTERTLMRETIYADERLTVTREVGQKPEVLLHVFAGATRVASKWVGGQGVFTYHAQLPTRTVSDVVYAQGDDRTTARLHQQIEYTAFGELLAGREKIIAQGTRDPEDRPRLTRPLYRFDAKEFDEETGLTYFGARHYSQRFGLWLSPDPILSKYLAGAPNGGVYSSRNLAAYSFGWGNPIGYLDKGGKAACKEGGCEAVENVVFSIPQSFDMAANVAKSKELANSNMASRYWQFYELVRNRGPWDYKQLFKKEGFFGQALQNRSLLNDVPAEYRHIIAPGDEITNSYAELGNWNFGFMGAAAGFSPQVLHRLAGWAQRQAGTSKESWSNPYFGGKPPFGDEPEDYKMIERGIRDYQNHPDMDVQHPFYVQPKD